MSDDPDFTLRTTSTTEGGYRIPDDLRTHTERINGTGPGRFGPREALDEPVLTDGDAPLLPHRTTEWSIVAGVRTPPGSLVYLKPHEVGPHHVPMEPQPAEPLPEQPAVEGEQEDVPHE